MTTNTDPIKSTQYNQQVSAYEEKVTKQQQKIREENEKKAKEAEAAALVEGLTQGITAYNHKDFKKLAEEALQGEINTRLATEDTSDDLTPEQIELAKKYIKSKEFKKERQEDLQIFAQQQLYGITGKDTIVDGTSTGAVRKDVRSELKRQYEAGEITKEQYEFLKKQTGGRNIFQKVFGTKKKDSELLFETEGRKNNRDQVQAGLTNEDAQVRTTAIMENIPPELKAKIDASGYTIEDLIGIYENNGGYADATVNYSYNKNNQGQIGEVKGLRVSLNENPNGFVFSEKDVKDLAKALGYHVEKTIDWGKVTKDAVKGAVVMSPVVVGAEANAVAEAASGSAVATATAKTVLPIGTGIGFVSGGIHSIVTQIKRVEPKAIPDDVFKGVTTYDDYCKRLKNGTTEDGYRLGSAIAKFYVNPNDGSFDITQLEQALHKSAGTVEADKTPLNYQEARGLLADLTSGKIKVEFAQPVQEEIVQENPQIVVEEEPYQEIIPIATCTHTVHKGDTWANVAAAKYGLSGDDLKAFYREQKQNHYNSMSQEERNQRGIKSPKDAFFFRAGETWTMPATWTAPSGKVYTANCDATVAPKNRANVYNGRCSSIQDNLRWQTEQNGIQYNGYDTTNPSDRKQFMKNERNRNNVSTQVNSYVNSTYPQVNRENVQITYPEGFNGN